MFISIEGLGFDLTPLPIIKKQFRNQKKAQSMKSDHIMGCDTETVDGRAWLVSFEEAGFEVESFPQMIEMIYHSTSRTYQGPYKKKGKRATYRSCPNLFFWNLGFDANAILKWLDPDLIEEVVENGRVRFFTTIEGQRVRMTIEYIEKKFMSISIDKWMNHISRSTGREVWRNTSKNCEKWVKLSLWDIAQYYGRQRLNNAAERLLGAKKDDLDAARLSDPQFRKDHREEIEAYAIKDALLCGKLARLMREKFDSQDVPFRKPYSIASLAQRELLSLCDIPKIDDIMRTQIGRRTVQRALTTYRGGWFETSGYGYLGEVELLDLASAYPEILFHLQNPMKGAWIEGDEHSFRDFGRWMGERLPYSYGFIEVYVEFTEGLPIYPLVQRTDRKTLANPRIFSGWITADEFQIIRSWPIALLFTGRWVLHADAQPPDPYRPFIEHFYEMKVGAEKASDSYLIAKILLNGIYGKTIQCIDGETGSLWNPISAATITAGTRRRIADLILATDHRVVSIATDGVAVNMEGGYVLPPMSRLLPAIHNLGEWESEGRGELLTLRSGVQSVRGEDRKTTARGTSQVNLNRLRYEIDDPQATWFDFCDYFENDEFHSIEILRPRSLSQSRMHDFHTMNVFEPQLYTLCPTGDVNKRLPAKNPPTTFGELRDDWYETTSHTSLEDVATRLRLDQALIDAVSY